MEAWRSNCPRHSVWEDASLDGLVQVVDGGVTLTPYGRAMLDAASRHSTITGLTPETEAR
jgi:hypothetical protein